jgi:hypothetical protein
VRKLLSVPLIAGLSFLLCGCFYSEAPRFSSDTAVAVFGDGGRFAFFEREVDGYQRKESFTMKRVKDGYAFSDDKGESRTVSFHDVGNGRLAIQAMPLPGATAAYDYAILIREGAEYFIYIPQCDRQDPKLLAEHTVGPIGKFECGIDKVSNPRALFGALDLGEPASKIVPE